MSMTHPANLIQVALIAIFAASCSGGANSKSQAALLQKSSLLGETEGWDISPPLSLKEIKDMRNRAYEFCLDKHSKDTECLKEQDVSLNFYVKAFTIKRIFQNNTADSTPFAVAIRKNPASYGRVHRYCRGIYVDHGSGDARELGPCMAAGLGADFFGVLPVD